MIDTTVSILCSVLTQSFILLSLRLWASRVANVDEIDTYWPLYAPLSSHDSLVIFLISNFYSRITLAPIRLQLILILCVTSLGYVFLIKLIKEIYLNKIFSSDTYDKATLRAMRAQGDLLTGFSLTIFTLPRGVPLKKIIFYYFHNSQSFAKKKYSYVCGSRRFMY